MATTASERGGSPGKCAVLTVDSAPNNLSERKLLARGAAATKVAPQRRKVRRANRCWLFIQVWRACLGQLNPENPRFSSPGFVETDNTDATRYQKLFGFRATAAGLQL